VPFLLRETQVDGGDQQFELVGECYVDGKMDDAFVREQEAKGISAEYFILA